MNTAPLNLGREETQAVLTEVLHELEGSDVSLNGWTADNGFTEYGKRRVVRYDLEARASGNSQLLRHRWVGKFYDSDEDARRVADVLAQLETSDGCAVGGVAVPRVLAYHAPRRLLLLTFEVGESVSSAIASDTEPVLDALGRALASLHAIRKAPDRTITPAAVLDDLRPRVGDLRTRFPSEADSLRNALVSLEHDPPTLPEAPSFVHGDFGPANLLWRDGHIVVLDFDKCARGDPALDLGNLFAQLFRITIRKPEKLRDFPRARARVLESYRHWSFVDPDFVQRVAWYERATLLRKMHVLAFKITRTDDTEAIRRRQADAVRLWRGG